MRDGRPDHHVAQAVHDFDLDCLLGLARQDEVQRRLDVGDEIYFNNGSHHNLRVAFGPVFRF